MNITGLALGVATALTIGAFILGELKVDGFQKEASSTYLFHWKQFSEDGKSRKAGLSSERDASLLKGNLSSITDVLMVRPTYSTFEAGGEKMEAGIMLAEPHFFSFFSFELKEGDPATALADPSSVVLSESFARSLFGDKNPIGQLVRLVGDYEAPLRVSGIVKDYPDSHLRINAIVPWSIKTTTGQEIAKWYSQSLYTYVKTAAPVPAASLEKEISDLYLANDYRLERDRPGVIAVSDIYMDGAELEFMSGFRFGSRFLVYTLGTAGLLTLLMACTNFINASTAQSMRRTREVGVRKSMGASARQLRWQFLLEALLVVAIASALGFTLADLAQPFFDSLTGRTIYINVWEEPAGLAMAGGIFVFTVVLSGLYPAFNLSARGVVESLKGTQGKFNGKNRFRETLMTFQFTATLCLIAGALLIYRQNEYMQSKDLGFNKEQVIVMSISQNSAIFTQQEAFMQELVNIPEVAGASAGMDALGDGYTNNSYYVVPEGGTVEQSGIMSTYFTVDHNFAEVYGIELEDGRFLSNNFASDTASVVINQSLARSLGYENPLNKPVKIWGDKSSPYRIVGVMKDFHFQSLHNEVRPAICILNSINGWNIAVRLKGNDYSVALRQIQQLWESMESEAAFNYTFLDDSFARFYTSDLRMFRAINFFSVLSIVVACLGLYGLTSFMVQQRTKEIGIRKVLGASVAAILLLLNKRLLLLLFAALAFAIPVTVWAISSWLSAFAYSAGIGWEAFPAAALLVAGIIVATVCLVSLNTVRRNPVKVLRYE